MKMNRQKLISEMELMQAFTNKVLSSKYQVLIEAAVQEVRKNFRTEKILEKAYSSGKMDLGTYAALRKALNE